MWQTCHLEPNKGFIFVRYSHNCVITVIVITEYSCFPMTEIFNMILNLKWDLFYFTEKIKTKLPFINLKNFPFTKRNIKRV